MGFKNYYPKEMFNRPIYLVKAIYNNTVPTFNEPSKLVAQYVSRPIDNNYMFYQLTNSP